MRNSRRLVILAATLVATMLLPAAMALAADGGTVALYVQYEIPQPIVWRRQRPYGLWMPSSLLVRPRGLRSTGKSTKAWGRHSVVSIARPWVL